MVNIELIVVLVVCSYLFGVYRTQMVSLFLLLSFSLNHVIQNIPQLYTSLHTTFISEVLIQPLIYIIFFTACLHYSINVWEKITVWAGVVFFALSSCVMFIYVPHVTEFLFVNSYWIEEEIIVNLVLVMTVCGREDKKDKWAELRYILILCMFIVVKMVQWTT